MDEQLRKTLLAIAKGEILSPTHLLKNTLNLIPVDACPLQRMS